jgi:lipopolysaccharide/colanic/teichoic acid biosynthesis glycosyltransferase
VKRLLELSGAPERLAAMGEAARKFVEPRYGRRDIFSKIPGLLAKALPPPVVHREYRLKRALDILLALAGFVVSSPLWVFIPLAIRLGDRGPIFYSQERVGLNGRWFGALKFRSMRAQELPESDRRQAQRGDPRVTRFGRWLRASAMDEVPQLWNILKGDMSFVGPRALLPAEIETAQEERGEIPLEQIPGYERRQQMRPGLTGIAQVYASRHLPRRQKFRYDLLYMERQNLMLDFYLLFRSAWNSLTARWESVGHRG